MNQPVQPLRPHLQPLDERGGLLPRLIAGPAAIGRTSRRLTRTSMFLLDVATHLRRNVAGQSEGPATSLRQQGFFNFFAENFCALQGVEIRVSGKLPRAPSLLVANHVSYLDPLPIAAVVPTLAVAKREVEAWPVIGNLCREGGLLLLDRGNAHSGARVLLETKTLLARGVSVLTFPEGTTTQGHDVLPFKRGMFGLAARLGAPVVPIGLTYADDRMAWVGDDLFLPHFIRASGYERIIVHLDLGEPLYAERGERAESLAERAREQVRTMTMTRRSRNQRTS